MRRESYEEIKNHKHFYRNCFRNARKFFTLSMAINILLVMGVFYKVITQPLPDFYATNGVTGPIQLTALAEANMSSQPLLPNDVPAEMATKDLPVGT